MLLPNMTYEEIYNEVSKDFSGLHDYIDRVAHAQFAKTIRRCVKFPLIKAYIYNSRITNIDYTILCFALRRSDWKHHLIYIYHSFAHDDGHTSVSIDYSDFRVNIYTGHFWKRYKERMGDLVDDDHLSKEIGFYMVNKDMIESEYEKSFEKISKFKVDEGYKRFVANCVDGASLCERNVENSKLVIYKTFISSDLMFEKQMGSYLKAHHEIWLRTLVRQYPNQARHIIDEWNSFMGTMPDNLTEYYQNKILKKIEDLENRYPVNYKL